MADTATRVEKFSSDSLRTWMRDDEQSTLFGDVFAEDDGASMDVTFIRWRAGEQGEFSDPLPYDEVFVITRGSYGVRTDSEEIVARPGEVIYLSAGATGVYFADEDAEVVAVTSPPYRRALRDAGHGGDLDALRAFGG